MHNSTLAFKFDSSSLDQIALGLDLSLVMFRQVRLADYEQQPKRPHVEPAQDAPQTVFPNGNVVSNEPLSALLLPPKPDILAQLAKIAESPGASTWCDLDPHTGWAMAAAPDGVRLWPIRGRNMEVTPILFHASTNLIPVFLNPQQGHNQPEIVLIGESTGEILHYKRISFALNEQPATSSLGLGAKETVSHAIAVGTNIACATSHGNLFSIRFRDGFGSISKPVVSRITNSWFSAWKLSPIVNLSSSGNKVACLRSSGQVSIYSVENAFTLLEEINLRSLRLSGKFLSLVFENETLYVVVQASPSSYRLARVVSGILEQQHIWSDINSSKASIHAHGSTKYLLFDNEIVVIQQSNAGVIETDPNMTLQSLVDSSKSINLQPMRNASLYLRDTVTVFGSKPSDTGILLLTSEGVLEVNAEISEANLTSLVEQAVFYWTPQSPLTFVPAVKAAIGSNGYVAANKAVISLCHDIANSKKVPPIPNIGAHLELRINRIRRLAQFSLEALTLTDEARVYLQNTLEQLLTARSLADLAGTVSSDPRNWLLYHTDEVVKLVATVPSDRVVDALYGAIRGGSPSLVSPGPDMGGYWLAQPDIVAVLKTGKNTPEYVELACTVLSFSSGNGTISPARAQQEQNSLLRSLASNGHDQEAIEITRKLGLWPSLASLICDQWLNEKVGLDTVAASISDHGYDFARVMFDHLKSQGQTGLITTQLRDVFPDYVYQYFGNDPNIQWALAELNGESTTATEILARACQKDTTDDRHRVMLASLLRIQATITHSVGSIDEASKILAQESARAQVKVAVRTPSPPGFAAVVAAETTDLVLKLALLPADAANYISAVNLLGWGSSDATKRVLAQQIVLNTDWDRLTETALIYQILWSSSVEKTGVQALRPFLLGDLQVGTDDVTQLVPQRLRAKMAADIAASNLKINQLPNIKDWIKGACDRATAQV